MDIKDLYDLDYGVQVINALGQRREKFNCIGAPKRCHMLLRLEGCRAVYRPRKGGVIHARSGDIVYIPQHSEYRVEFMDFESAQSGTVHINFFLYDAAGTPMALSKGITIFSADNANYHSLFAKMERYSQAAVQCHGKLKALMYELLFSLSEFYHRDHRDKYGIIAGGIAYLESEDTQALSIREIADMCRVSEVYFRKLFKEYAGVSPTRFRTQSKISRAKNYLTQEDISIAEISDLLGFAEVSYFIRVFKKSTGLTPKEYRRKAQI